MTDKTVACVTKTRITRGDATARKYRNIIRAELSNLGQGPFFCITMDTYRQARNNHWYEDSFGRQDERIAELCPELRKYQKWNLVGVRGPMHYKANACYWHSQAKQSASWDKGINPEYLNSTIVYGALPSDYQVVPFAMEWEELSAWLDARYDALMQAFRSDMRELFGAQLAPDALEAAH